MLFIKPHDARQKSEKSHRAGGTERLCSQPGLTADEQNGG